MTEHVKIKGIKPRIQYLANGILTDFTFPFAIFDTSDIKVYVNDELQESTEYTVSTPRDTNGGTVSFEIAPPSDSLVTIIRDLSIERTSDFQEGGALRADTLNDELDYQIACQQQIADYLNRTMVLPPYAVDSDVDFTLPTPQAGKAIVWNADGTNLENSTVEVNALESTLRGYKESAESAATTATEKASIASDKANVATAKAQIATEKADEATITMASKASKDMDNLSENGKTIILSLGIPDYTAGISLNYTTVNTNFPINGIAYFGYKASTNTSANIYINDQEFGLGGSSAGNNSTQTAYRVSTDDVYRFQTSSNGQFGIIYPLKGEQNA